MRSGRCTRFGRRAVSDPPPHDETCPEHPCISTTELLEQPVALVKAIDWSTITGNQEAMEALSSVEYTWSRINEVIEDWKYLPLTLTHE